MPTSTGGLELEDIDRVRTIKSRRGSLEEFADERGFGHAEGSPWQIDCDMAFSCATENEIDATDATALIEGGCQLVCEGANMPCTADAIERFRDACMLFGSGNTANAGGVVVSEFEMAQAASRQRWDRGLVDRRLRNVMESIHDRCVEDGEEADGGVDYSAGAAWASFESLAGAMLWL